MPAGSFGIYDDPLKHEVRTTRKSTDRKSVKKNKNAAKCNASQILEKDVNKAGDRKRARDDYGMWGGKRERKTI